MVTKGKTTVSTGGEKNISKIYRFLDRFKITEKQLNEEFSIETVNALDQIMSYEAHKSDEGDWFENSKKQTAQFGVEGLTGAGGIAAGQKIGHIGKRIPGKTGKLDTIRRKY